MVKNKKGNKAGHPEEDQFIEGKIGSGYMSTIQGQPDLEDFVENEGENKPNYSSRQRDKS